MKKMIMLFTFAILGNFCFAQNSTNSTSPPVSLTIESENKGAVKSNGLLIKVQFNNLRNETIKLLDLFEPEGIFLSIRIRKEDEKNDISPLRGGKMDFGTGNKFKYIEITNGTSYKKVLNISAILKKQDIILPPAKYIIWISYHNQYGDDCIKGRFNSNEIAFVID